MSLAARKIRLIMELRTAGVSDTRVLSAIERVPRELFVPETFRDKAYDNMALPIGHGQTISQPVVVGLMTQVLELGPRMKVLEIGTGSGYQAAVLAPLVRRLYTLERHRPLLAEAERKFRDLRIPNITTIVGDGARGWPEQAPFDRILATCAALDVPEKLVSQLAVGGVMVLPMGSDEQRIVRVTRTEDGYTTEPLMPVRFVPLIGGTLPEDEAWRMRRQQSAASQENG